MYSVENIFEKYKHYRMMPLLKHCHSHNSQKHKAYCQTKQTHKNSNSANDYTYKLLNLPLIALLDDHNSASWHMEADLHNMKRHKCISTVKPEQELNWAVLM